MLRSFANNPSLGGFGGESQLATQLSQTVGNRQDNDIEKSTNANINNNNTQDNVAGSCDAFVQILKELVDNAVDACVSSNDKTTTMDDKDNTTMKRVRVKITSESVPVASKMMNCLRLEVSDNGCGMEDIDKCVSAFSSNKQQTKDGRNDNDVGEKVWSEMQSIGKKKKVDKTKKQSSSNNNGSTENYTSGRYGVGLTLCILHAQRLVPGTGASITSATASSEQWTRAVYEPDTTADSIVCKKREQFPKHSGNESGTTISLLVPGGEEAKRVWPRLAEYFARFQLSIDLPCSIELKAPTLQTIPLYIRPPVEMERRGNRNSTLGNESDSNNSNDGDDKLDQYDWEGGDGFDENSLSTANTTTKNHKEPKLTKAAKKRAEAELQQKRKLSLLCKAASTYQRRPDLKLGNVAHSTQPIRRNSGKSSESPKNGPVLEIGLIVFGPQPEYNDDSDNEDDIRNQNDTNQLDNSSDSAAAKLQVVRMVNGIPLLDSSEALACGVVKKISSNTSNWNSFGLNLQNSEQSDLDTIEENTITFDLKDSAQVAPFLKSTTHSLFRGQSQIDDKSSSEDGDSDVENIRGGKRKKKEGHVKCILPASLRLGDVLMVVQIRATPSALPLPTLSKGRLPLNDKGINDALENGVSDCLRCLQKSSKGLLLTAQQLKKVERDVKYAPSAAGAIASILCRSRQKGVYDRAVNISSGWNDDDDQKMGNKLNKKLRRKGRGQTALTSQVEDERAKVDALRLILERRLKFVVSDEYKNAKRAKEKELQRIEREEAAAERKRAKQEERDKSDALKCDDGLDSDSGDSRMIPSQPTKNGSIRSKEYSFDSSCESSQHRNSRRRWKGSSFSSSEQSSETPLSNSKNERLYATNKERVESPVSSSATRSIPDVHDAESPHSRVNNESIEESDKDNGIRNRGRAAHAGYNDGYESCLSNPQHNKYEKMNSDGTNVRDTTGLVPSKSKLPDLNQTKYDEDPFSSDESEWSSQFGEVVPGHFFR